MEYNEDNMFDSPTKTPPSFGSGNSNDRSRLFASAETVFKTNSIDRLDDLTDMDHLESIRGNSGLHFNDSVTTWATEIRSALHQLVTNHNLSDESGDVFTLTSAIVGALECLQTQQSQLTESKEEQKALMNQLRREKDSREEFEARTVDMEEEIDEMKRKQREQAEKTRNDKRKLDLEIINLRDTVSRLEVQKKDVEKEVEGLRERYTKSMQRYMEDLNRLKAQQTQERENMAEKDMKICGDVIKMKRIRDRLTNGGTGPYDSCENFVLTGQDEEALSSSLGMVKNLNITSAAGTQMNESKASGVTITARPSSEVFREGSTIRSEFKNAGLAPDEEAYENEGTSTPRYRDSGSPNREHSLSSSVDMSHLQSEVAAALRGHSNKQDNESVFEASGSFNRQRLEASISEDGFPLMRDGRTLSVQSFETNHEPLFNEFQNANQGGVYTSSQDILRTRESNWSNAFKFSDNQKIDESFEDWNYEDDDNQFQRGQKGFYDVASAASADKKFTDDTQEKGAEADTAGFVPLQLQGMNEEVHQLLEENARLQETKNALNIVKDDLIAKVDQLTNEQEFMREETEALLKSRDELQERLIKMDSEAKRLNAELEKTSKLAERKGSEATISLADELNMTTNGGSISGEKKFTRREVSTLLMERNMYKERYLELQETVRWMGMMQAERSKHPDLLNNSSFNSTTADQRKMSNSGGIWRLFSGLFGSSAQGSPGTGSTNTTKRPSVAGVTALKFDSTSPTVYTAVKATRSQSTTGNRAELDRKRSDRINRKLTPNPIASGDQQTPQAATTSKVHSVEGREDIYGWSVNASLFTPQKSSSASERKRTSTARRQTLAIPEESEVKSSPEKEFIVNQKEISKSLPIPAYSRPLMEKDPSFKQYHFQEDSPGSALYIENLTLQCACSLVLSGGQYSPLLSSSRSLESSLDVTPTLSTPEDLASTFSGRVGNCSIVWLCSSSATCSRVSLYDLSSPAEALSSLTFAHSQILTIHAVPGYSNRLTEVERPAEFAGDTLEAQSENSFDQSSNILDFGKEGGGGSSLSGSDVTATNSTTQDGGLMIELNEAEDHLNDIADDVLNSSGSANGSVSSPKLNGNKTNQLPKCYWPPKVTAERDLLSSSKNPTVWIGCENGNLFVHSAVAEWNKCIHSVRLPSSVNTIDFIEHRVFVGLSGGSVAVFYRDSSTHEWDLHSYQLLDLGKPAHTVRCSVVAPAAADFSHMNLWLGYRNKVHIVDPVDLKIKATISAHVRRESQVRYMAVCGLGVWISIRMESTLKLFHATTHQHLQDINPEASIIRIIGQACRINFLRITSLSCIGNILWIGTNVGVIVTLPVGEESQSAILSSSSRRSSMYRDKGATAKPGGIVRVFNHSEDPTSPNSQQQTATIALTSSQSSERSMTSSSSNSGWEVQLVSNGDSPGKSQTLTPQVQRTANTSLMGPRSPAGGSLLSTISVPYCNLSQMRLSFHAHRHDVKFFVGAKQASVADLQSSMSSTSSSTSADKKSDSAETLHVMSGGRGYIDHRIGDKVDDSEQNVPVVVSSTNANVPSLTLGPSTISGAPNGTSPAPGAGNTRASKQVAKSQRSHIILWKQDLPSE
ncbi:C-Jun-amino-terminal kinase-interacting protein 3-like isoform X4 [Convolutriloba macropyga]|uniref:C-Jun-amino-terminal kinase-interacting protein 3-like isoform X4 n=1 Tax=Convolutriloba macropyga TaxID=536237 RepID=UPI003F521ACF